MQLAVPKIQSVTQSGEIPAGVYSSVEFVFDDDTFQGSVLGSTIDGAIWQTLGPIIAPHGQKLDAIAYVVDSGSFKILTVA